MAKLVLQSTSSDPLFFFLTQSSDHITGLTGATATTTISKNGAAFGAPAGAVTEIANGWYQVAGNATDTNTLGDILLHATATSADPCDMIVAQVVAFNPRNANLGLTNVSSNVVQVLGAAISTTSAQLGVNVVNFGGTAVTGRDIGASVLLSSGTATGQLNISTGNLVGSVGSVVGNIGGSVASVLGAVGSVTAAVTVTGTVNGNLIQILGSAVPGTPAQVATSFGAFFNVVTPTGTVNSLPAAIPGSAGGVFIAGSNATTTVNIIGSLSGSVGNVTGAVGSVTGNVGGNVVGSVGSVTAVVAANVTQVNSNTTAAVNVSLANQAIGRGTCTTGASTTSIPTSAFAPGGAGIASGQFIGRTIIFDATTTTPSLQGQATNITGNTSGANPTFTVVALTTAPASGDTFGVY